MKNKIERELEQKEFENEIERDLRKQELDIEHEEKMDSDYHPVALFAIRFFSNLMIGYILFLIVRWFGAQFFAFASSELINGLFLIFHILIWGFAVIGVVTKKSPWERFLS